MEEEDLDKLFECFKKCEPNRCGKNTSKDKLLYYNKPSNANCSNCQKIEEYQPTQTSTNVSDSAISNPRQPANLPAEPVPEPKQLAPEPSQPASEPAQCACGSPKPASEVSVDYKCCKKNSVPVTETMQKPTKIKQDSFEKLNNALCSACQNLDAARDDFRENLKSLQNQIDSTYRNIESVRDLNKDLKNGVCHLQNSINSLKEEKKSLENFKQGSNVELLCACKPVQKQLETFNKPKKYSIPTDLKCNSCNNDEPTTNFKQPNFIRCCATSENQMTQLVKKVSKVTIGETTEYPNKSDSKCYPCNEESTAVSLKKLSFVTCGETQPINQVTKTRSYSNESNDKCDPCNKDKTSISLKKTSFASCCEAEPCKTAGEGTSIIDNITKCAEQCRQYLEALTSAARSTNTNPVQDNATSECAWKKNSQPTQKTSNVNSFGTEVCNITESAHKCYQCNNKRNSATQEKDFKTNSIKYDVQVQCDWETNDQSTQYSDFAELSTIEVAVGNDPKECTHKGVQCSNKKNNATQFEKPVQHKNDIQVQSTWDTKNQATQYDQISNVETEIFNDLIKCSKCTQSEAAPQHAVQTEVCKTCNIQGSAKFSSAWKLKDETTQSVGKDAALINTAHECTQCASVKQNATQADNVSKCSKKDEATLAKVPKIEHVNKCQQCSTKEESPVQTQTVQENEKVQCAWKKNNQATQAAEEVYQNLQNEAVETNKCQHCANRLGYSAEMNNFKTFNIQNSVKSQTESRDSVQTRSAKTVHCLLCAKEAATVTHTKTEDSCLCRPKIENKDKEPVDYVTNERTNSCPHCSKKIDNTAQTNKCQPLTTHDSTQSAWQTENKTTQSITESYNQDIVGKNLNTCTKCNQVLNGITNGSQSEQNDESNRKNAAVQCAQRSYNAATQSMNEDTKSNTAEASIGSKVPNCVDKCQQCLTKKSNAAQTEKFETSSAKAQCALEVEDKITQAAAELCRHCLNKIRNSNADNLKGFNFQNSIKSQTNSIGESSVNDSMKCSLQNSIKVQTTSNENINKNLTDDQNKCCLCSNAAQTDSIKSFNLQTSVKSQTETNSTLSKLKIIKSRNIDSIDKGIQSSSRKDRGSQTDKIPVPRQSVKIQTDTSARKKSNTKRSSFPSQTDLKRSSSRIRTLKQQQAGQSSSGILKNKSPKKKYCSACQTYNVKTSPLSSVSLTYAGKLNSERCCNPRDRNCCYNRSNYGSYNRCSDTSGYSSCYLWP